MVEVMRTRERERALAPARAPVGRPRGWPDRVGYLAAAWSLLYGLLGLYWAAGGVGFPFGPAGDPEGERSTLWWLEADGGGPVIAGLGLVGAAVAMVMARGWGRGSARLLPLGFAVAVAAVLTLVIPDARVLVAVGYAPIALLGAPFDGPPFSYLEVVPWPVLNQVVLMAGGLLWAATAVAYRRRTGGACVGCGRRGGPAGWTSPEAAARWGRWAVAVAVVVPLCYAVTRWAWALGIPLGISEPFLSEGQRTGLWLAGAALGALAAGGALLTLGLVQRWGEVFPAWVPVLGRRRVPPALAVVHATWPRPS